MPITNWFPCDCWYNKEFEFEFQVRKSTMYASLLIWWGKLLSVCQGHRCSRHSPQQSWPPFCRHFQVPFYLTSNGYWCMGIKGEMSGTVCVTFTWDMYIYIWVVYSFCLFCCLFIVVAWWYVWCIEWASGNQEEVQACLVTLCLFIISCYSLYKTTI